LESESSFTFLNINHFRILQALNDDSGGFIRLAVTAVPGGAVALAFLILIATNLQVTKTTIYISAYHQNFASIS
jgi:hypothetical protein